MNRTTSIPQPPNVPERPHLVGTAPTDASRPAVNRAWVRTVDARLALIDALFTEDDGRCPACGDYPQDSSLIFCVEHTPDRRWR